MIDDYFEFLKKVANKNPSVLKRSLIMCMKQKK